MIQFYGKVDYEKTGQGWNRMVRGSLDDWERNLATIVQWSPYLSEEVLLQQVSLFLVLINHMSFHSYASGDQRKKCYLSLSLLCSVVHAL